MTATKAGRYCDVKSIKRSLLVAETFYRPSLRWLLFHPHSQSIVASPLKVLNHFAVINTLIGARESPFRIGMEHSQVAVVDSRSPRVFRFEAKEIGGLNIYKESSVLRFFYVPRR